MMRNVILAATLTASSAVVADASGNIDRIAWLQGCWQSVAGDRTIEEQWTTPRGESMLGIGRTVSGDTLVEYEFVVVRERGERLVYIAHPSGQPSAEFLSTTASPTEVVFENAEHDFPQRVGYQRQGTALDAWIDGTKNGQTRRINFHYQRVACPGD
jgi:hypothetical protein